MFVAHNQCINTSTTICVKDNDGINIYIYIYLLNRSNLSLDNFDGHCPAMIEEIEESAMEEAAKMSKLKVLCNVRGYEGFKLSMSQIQVLS